MARIKKCAKKTGEGQKYSTKAPRKQPATIPIVAKKKETSIYYYLKID
jgi:hypothetical protein